MSSAFGTADRVSIFVDYGGEILREKLKKQPVKLEDCNKQLADKGDKDEQICLAHAYLSVKDCDNAKIYALKVFEHEKYSERIEQTLDLLGRLEAHDECL